MKKYSKIAILVVSVIFLTLTACTLKASTPPPAQPSPSGEAQFPSFTPGVGTFGTQTVIAQTPVSTTPQVNIATETGQPQQGATQTLQAQGGGQIQPQAAQPTATGAVAAVNTPVVNRPTNYTLQKGEWPICIARRYNLDIPSFFAANGLNMSSKPGAGTNLKIPATGTWNPVYGARALKQHPTTYTVVAGDTVNSIACAYGDVTPEAILTVNALSSASDIKAGMSLKIP